MVDFRDVARAGSELAVTIGIIEAAIEQHAPDEVKQNFEEKVTGLIGNMERELEEFLSFGEAYDRD